MSTIDPEIARIREYVFAKYVEGTAVVAKLDEEAALEKLRAHHRATDVSVDGETYYLGILYFELAFNVQAREKEFMARAKVVLEGWRERNGDAWDVVDDRIDDATSVLADLPAAQREELLSTARTDLATLAGPAQGVMETNGPVVKEGMVFVASGVFLSGRARQRRETKSFWIDQNPVTNAEYGRFREVTGYRQPRYWPEGRFRDPEAPVVGVSWYDAFKFAAWAGKALPSKDQWEKAARGRSGRVFPWGDVFDATRCACGWSDAHAEIERVGAHPEGASEFGANDMCGLVWEWTDSPDPNEPEQKVICGGSWCDPLEFLRCDEYMCAYPKDKYDNIGFRCIRLGEAALRVR